MKKLTTLLLTFIMIFTLTACGNSSGGTADNSNAPASGTAETEDGRINLKFAWVIDNIDLSQQSLYDFAQDYMAYLNATRKDIHVETVLYDCLADVEQQTTNMELALTSGCDAIILSGVDEEAARTYVNQAIDQGIPVLNWRNDGNGTVFYNSASEAGKGQMAAEWFEQYLKDHPDVELNICLQYGSVAHPNNFPRVEGIRAVEESMPDRFHILDEQNGDWGSEKAMAMAEDWIQKYPNINAIASANEEQMLGCIEALRNAGLLEDAVLLAYNGEQTGIDLIKAGELDCDIAQRPTHYIPLLIETTIKMTLEGLEGEVNYSDQVLYTVTPENVDEYEASVGNINFMENTYFETTLLDDYTGYSLYWKNNK